MSSQIDFYHMYQLRIKFKVTDLGPLHYFLGMKHEYGIFYPSRSIVSSGYLRLACPKMLDFRLCSEGSRSLYTDSEYSEQVLQRRWFLTRPDTNIQPVLVSVRPESEGMRGLERLQFSNCKEPVEAEGRMKHYGKMYVIRDDLLHPLMGGNKLRKLDALLPFLESTSVTDVVTCGGCQSAHTAALAVACAERGLRAHSLLRGEKLSVPTGYHLLSGMYSNVIYASRLEYANREAMLSSYAEKIAENGPVLWLQDMQIDLDDTNSKWAHNCSHSSKKVAIVREGAGDGMALLGLVRLVKYLAQSCFSKNKKLQLVVDSGTGTTAIGLAVGILLLGLPWEVVSVALAGTPEDYTCTMRRLLDEFNKMLAKKGHCGLDVGRLDKCIQWVERQRPRKFGKVFGGEIETCRRIAKGTGILLDPIYTLAAWEIASELTISKQKDEDKMVVVLHTGGTLGLFGLAQRFPADF